MLVSNVPQDGLGQWKPVRTIPCIESELLFMLTSFAPMFAEVPILTRLKLCKGPVIIANCIVEAVRRKVAALTPRSDDSIRFFA